MTFEPQPVDDDRSYPPDEVTLRAFYQSREWRRFAYRVKKERGRRCEMCGATPDDGVRIVLDHIRPVRFYWHLRLTETNVQVLCEDDNLGKGSWDTTDFRKPNAEELRDKIDRLVASNAPLAELKEAVITAYSFGAISGETTKTLFEALDLKHA